MQKIIIRLIVRAVFALALLFGFNSFAYAQSVPPPVFDIPQPFVMPGTTEGDDTHFTITDSQYLNVTLDSSEQIKLKMDSVPEMVTLTVESSASSTATSTQVTLSGFATSTTYYKYEDSYHNLDQFVTDASGGYSYSQDLSKTHIVFIQPRHSTKFISDNATGGDCTQIGSWNYTTRVCTMNTDLTETIQIDSNNVTLDGNHHTLTGYNTGNGVYLNGRGRVTIRNLNISNFTDGIFVYNSSYNTLVNNTISNNTNGIELVGPNNTLTRNTVFNSSRGILLRGANNNTLTGNTAQNNSFGIFLFGSNNNTLSGNNALNNYKNGIDFFVSSGNTLSGNTFSKNAVSGISNFPWSLPIINKIYNNNFLNNPTQVYIDTRYTNTDIFNLAPPIGGNYWSNFDTASEGCRDANNDNICDSAYVFPGGQDNLPWTKQDGWLAPTSTAKNINVAIILAEPVDVSHTTASTTAQPCKLIPEKTYANGYGEEYYTDLAYCINDYYKEVSHGSLSFTFTIFDNGGLWYKTDKTEAYYGANDKEDEFVEDAITISAIDLRAFDVAAVVHAGESDQMNATIPKSKLSTGAWGRTILFWQPPLKIIISEREPVGVWMHEVGHTVGTTITPENTPTPDLYLMGNVGRWDLMADGDWNVADNNVSDPPFMTSFTQEFLGLLSEDIHPKSAYGTYQINSLETSELGDTIFRYNLEENTNSSTDDYYILEARNRNLKIWDSSLPEEKSLVLYRVGASGFLLGKKQTITIPSSPTNSTSTISVDDGVLSVSGETYKDLDKFVEFSTSGDQTVNGKYEIATSITKIPKESFNQNYNGSVLSPLNDFLQYIKGDMFMTPVRPGTIPRNSIPIDELLSGGGLDTRICAVKKMPAPLLFLVLSIILVFVYKKKSVINIQWRKVKIVKVSIWVLWSASVITWGNYLYYLSALSTVVTSYDAGCAMFRTCENLEPCYRNNGFMLSSPLDYTLPDLDLHAITPDGKHIGMNYVTGEYENQIPGSIVSGDNQGIPEWVYVPEGTQVKYYVSAHDNDEFLKQNPGLASTMATTTDSYSLYARTIDPTVGIFTSPILENQTIAPTEEKTYLIDTVGTDVSVQESNDLTAPVTIVMPSGTLGSNDYYTSAVTVALTADDGAPLGEVSSGVADTKYSLDNGTTWNTYSTSTPLVIATEGSTTLQYYSVDNSGNSEAIKTLTFNIDTVAPTIFASDTSAEQLTAGGTLLTVPVTVNDSIDASPTFTTDVPLTQIFAPGVTNILITAHDMAGNIATSSIAITIYSSPAADPDGDGVPNQDDVKPFDATVFVNLIIPSEYSLWEKESFDLPFSVAGKGDVNLILSNTYYRIGTSPVKDSIGTTVPATVTTTDGVITVSFAQSTKELKTYTLTLATTKGNTKERDSIKKKRDHEGDEERRRDLEKELDFAGSPITLGITNTSANKTTSEMSIVNIYDKQQTAQLQYKYKDTNHSTTLLLKSDDTLKLKKGQPLEMTVKVTGIKKDVPFASNIVGNFTMLNVVQEEEHDNDNDRKQTKFSLFFPQSLATTQENITITTTVNGITQMDVVGVRFEE
ncbi:MAG: NosD domain-containing protein [Candidatus Paceibacterota bacterium]|jgi:M6 family metalloprotease-like protein